MLPVVEPRAERQELPAKPNNGDEWFPVRLGVFPGRPFPLTVLVMLLKKPDGIVVEAVTPVMRAAWALGAKYPKLMAVVAKTKAFLMFMVTIYFLKKNNKWKWKLTLLI